MSDQGLSSDELDLRTKRLKLQLLEQELSPSFKLKEWLQALAVPIAFAGVIVAGLSSWYQFRESSNEQSVRHDESLESGSVNRFAKALDELSGDNPQERNVGVSGLRLLVFERAGPTDDAELTDNIEKSREEALHYVVNALSVEKDAAVQDALTEVFWDIPTLLAPSGAEIVTPAEKDEALATAAERSRGSQGFLTAAGEELVSKERASNPPPVDLQLYAAGLVNPPTEGRLFEQLKKHLGVNPDPLSKVAGDRAPLDGLSEALEALVIRGAAAQDMSEIYCPNCQLSNLRLDVPNAIGRVTLSDAFLSRTKFGNADLRGVVFDSADLAATDFSHATFDRGTVFDWQADTASGMSQIRHARIPNIPILTDTTLTGANLSGMLFANFRLLLGKTNVLELIAPLISSAKNNLQGTTFFPMQVLVTIELPEKALHDLPAAQAKALFKRFFSAQRPDTGLGWLAPNTTSAANELIYNSTPCQAKSGGYFLISKVIRLKNIAELRTPAQSLLLSYFRSMGVALETNGDKLGPVGANDLDSPANASRSLSTDVCISEQDRKNEYRQVTKDTVAAPF